MRYQVIKSEWSLEQPSKTKPHVDPSLLSKPNDRILLKERLRRVFQFYPDPNSLFLTPRVIVIPFVDSGGIGNCLRDECKIVNDKFSRGVKQFTVPYFRH